MHGSAISPSADRQETLAQLYLSAQTRLTFALDSEGVSPADTISILALLEQALSQYTGRLTDTAFLRWATKRAKDEARRFLFVSEALEQNDKLIMAAIRDGLRGTGQDLAIEPEDIYLDFARYFFQTASSFYPRSTDTAKLSSRLYAAAKRHTLLYYTTKRQNRHRIMTEWPPLGVAYVTSPEEVWATSWHPDGETWQESPAAA